MSAIKKYMATIAESRNRTNMLLEAWKEASDRLDALEEKAKPDTERSCEQPAQEQGGDDYAKRYVCAPEGMEEDSLGAYVKHTDYRDLRAQLEKAEAKVKELTATMLDNGELAIRRGREIERLEKENAELKRKLSEVNL